MYRLPYCKNCVISMTDREREECMLHWRPGLGTKFGFPKNGLNCPNDTLAPLYTKLIDAMRAEWVRMTRY